MSNATAANARNAKPASAKNATRQPTCWPSQVPAGTPSIGASDAPANTTEVTRPRTGTGNIPAAAGATTAQNNACVKAAPTRAENRNA